MKIPVIALALLCPLGAQAALVTPQPVDKDGNPHVRTATWSAKGSYLITGAQYRPLIITFGADEHILRVPLETESLGGPDGKTKLAAPWAGLQDQAGAADAATTLGNVLPLWAMRPGRSAAQVVTISTDGTKRVYPLQLRALPPQPNDCDKDDCDDPNIITELTFIHPEIKKKVDQTAALQARSDAARNAALARLKVDVYYGPHNHDYWPKGTAGADRRLAPNDMWDNTQSTAFLWKGRRRIPTIIIVEHGEERPVTPEPVGELLVVHEVAALWRLRDGDDRDSVLDITNGAYHPEGSNPWTGTTSPEIQRIVKTPEGKPQ